MRSKPHKTAAELAELIRSLVKKPELRVAVYPTTSGWRAKVYTEPGENAAQLQALVDEKSAVLGRRFELIQ